MKLLLTAFEPFGGERINASLEALSRVEATADTELTRLVLPCVFGLAAETALEAVSREKPDAVVCLGQAAGRDAITPERRAVNLRKARIPDNAGNTPSDESIVAGAAEDLFSTLPIEAMCDAITACGIPARISESAGTFVCNDLMYGLLSGLRQRGIQIPAGFVHVPCLPGQAEEGSPSMPLSEIVVGLNAALAALEAAFDGA